MDVSGRKKIYPVKRILIFGALLSAALIFLGRSYLEQYIFGPAYSRLSRLWIDPEPLIVYREHPKAKYVLRTSFSDDRASQVHQKYGTGMDTCRILMQCFVGSDVYGDPVVCKKNLDPTIKYYDSGFMVEVKEGEEDRVVGFMSIHHDVSYKSRNMYQRKQQNLPPQLDDYHAFILYNVCIDQERRGQGVAKKMIPQFIDELIKHYKLEKYANSNGRDIDPVTGRPVPPLLIGLDVDLTSDTMTDAFSLYAKLGFIRWWTPCTSVANHKWTSLIDAQMNYSKDNQGYSSQDRRDENGNVKKASGLLPTHNGDFPAAQLLWDPNPYLKNAFNLGSSANRPTHFCMYKFYVDSYGSVAKRLLEYSANQK